MNRCTKREQGIELEYIQGPTLEEYLDSYLENKEYEQAWKFTLSDNFYLSSQGLILQYGEYEIGPYVVGLPRLTIPYDQLQTVLKKQYLPPVEAKNTSMPASTATANKAQS